MSSSSESEDENLKKFAESVDVSVFSNNLYKKSENAKGEPKVELKSLRTLDTEENIFQSEINVSSTMQQFIGKKLSKLIEGQVEFVSMNSEQTDEDEAVDNLRLLSGTEKVIKFIHEPTFIENRKKVPTKRRNVDEESEPAESEKVQSVVLNSKGIQDEIKQWKNKPKRKPTEYKSIKGTAHIRESTNEFTKDRNRNNWSETKIKGAKFHNPPICEIIHIKK